MLERVRDVIFERYRFTSNICSTMRVPPAWHPWAPRSVDKSKFLWIFSAIRSIWELAR